jgi:hypothetical protein
MTIEMDGSMKACPALPGMRRFAILIAIAATTALSGCDYFGFTSIKEITATPAHFEGTKVKIKGKVMDPVQVFSMKTYTLRDETGEITVSASGPLPASGADVALEGTVKSAVIIGGKSIGLHVEETRRLR